jgi:hypothetical protein
VAKPGEFNGRSDQLEQFIHQCTLFLALGTFSDQQKVTTVLSYMKKGSALTWAKQKLNEYATANWVVTWANFLLELHATFRDVARDKVARIRIHEIKQTKTVDEYNVEFMALATPTGFNDEALIDIWKKGLKPNILRRIYNEATIPATFAAWRAHASHYDHVDREFNAAFPRDHSSSTKSKTRHISSSSSTRQGTPTTSSTPKPTSTSSAPVKVKQEHIEESIFAAHVA